jgi:hypothetical protein
VNEIVKPSALGVSLAETLSALWAASDGRKNTGKPVPTRQNRPLSPVPSDRFGQLSAQATAAGGLLSVPDTRIWSHQPPATNFHYMTNPDRDFGRPPPPIKQPEISYAVSLTYSRHAAFLQTPR